MKKKERITKLEKQVKKLKQSIKETDKMVLGNYVEIREDMLDVANISEEKFSKMMQRYMKSELKKAVTGASQNINFPHQKKRTPVTQEEFVINKLNQFATVFNNQIITANEQIIKLNKKVAELESETEDYARDPMVQITKFMESEFKKDHNKSLTKSSKISE